MTKPETREELFLAAAAGQRVELPAPVTRTEKLLKAIADNIPTDEHINSLIDARIAEIQAQNNEKET